jgi:hypothetical protein
MPDTDKLLAVIDRAFASVPRPARFTTCTCDECEGISRQLQAKARDSLTCEDLESLCLLSPEGRTYLAPAQMRMCLETTPDAACDACMRFVHSELGQPLDHKAFPVMHPRFAPLTGEQTEVMLTFLKHLRDTWYPNESEAPRPLKRAIVNWSHFAGTPVP